MSKQTLLFGFHAVISRLRLDPKTVTNVYVEANRRDRRMQDFIALAQELKVRLHPVDNERLKGIAGTDRHQGVVAQAEHVSLALNVDELLDSLGDDPNNPPLLLVLDGVTDPHNLGACLRVADGAGVHAIIAPKDRSAGLNATASKVASGAAESIPYITVTNLARTLRDLQDRGIWVVGTDDQADKDIYTADLTGPMALVMGAEGEGMRRLTRETCDSLVSIPMLGTVESLNVSVASGVCLYEIGRQRRAKKK